MPPSGRQRLQETLRETLRGAVSYHGLPGRSELARVDDISPVVAELHSSRLALREGENLLLCQQVRQYDTDYGLDPDDNLLVTLVHGGMWVAYAVISDNDVVVTPR